MKARAKHPIERMPSLVAFRETDANDARLRALAQRLKVDTSNLSLLCRSIYRQGLATAEGVADIMEKGGKR